MSTRRGSAGALIAALLASCSPQAPAPPARVAEAAHEQVDTPAPPAIALVPLERCGETKEGFEGWVESFRRYALTQGISGDVAAVLSTVDYDPGVIELDRSQRPFKVPFEEFRAKHVTERRVRRGKQLLAEHADLLARIKARFGVPAEIVVALWGLETDFGANQGSTPSLRALATLAYDCRRADHFRGELLSALRIVQRGDLSADEMVGAWAGELGQTQFLPSSYERFGIDFDGDGRVDLIGSAEDSLASTANYLAGHGWRRDESYQPGSPNYAVLAEWNKSDAYTRTVVIFASKLAGRR